MRTTRTIPFAALATLAALPLLAPQQAAADFVLLDDYESYAIGTQPNGNPDIAYFGNPRGDFTVVADPDGGDQALAVQGGENGQSFLATNGGPLSSPVLDIEDGSTSTLFFQYRVSEVSDPNIVFNLAYEDDAGSFNGSTLNFKVRNFGNPTQLDIVAGNDDGTNGRLIPNATYNFYAVVDNALGDDDSLELYIQSDEDPSYATLTQVQTSSDYTKPFGAQPSTGEKYNKIGISVFGDQTAVNFIDNLYYDDDGQNLTNPIPEPGSATVGALIAPLLLRRRRA